MLSIFFATFAAHMASLDKDEDSFPRVKTPKVLKTSWQKCIIRGEDRNEIQRKEGAVANSASAIKKT